MNTNEVNFECHSNWLLIKDILLTSNLGKFHLKAEEVEIMPLYLSSSAFIL